MRAGFAWALAGNAVSGASQWLLIVLLAKLATPDTVGKYALALAINSPIFLLASLNLRTIQATEVTQERPFSFYLSLRLLACCLALAASGATIWLGGHRGETAATILMLACARFVDGVSETFYGRLQQQERMDQIAKSLMARSLLALLALGGIVRLTQSAFLAALGVCLAASAVLVCYDLWTIRTPGESRLALLARIRPRSSGLAAHSRFVIHLAGPSAVLLALVSLNANLPRYWLARHVSERAVGLFSALAYVTVAGNTVVMALGQAASSRMAHSYASGNWTQFLRIGLALAAAALAAGGALIAIAGFGGAGLLALLYGSDYARETGSFLWLMVAGAFSYLASAAGYVLSSARCYLPQLPVHGATVLATALALLLLVPGHGLEGAGAAQAIGYLVQTALSAGLIAGLRPRAAHSAAHLDTANQRR